MVKPDEVLSVNDAIAVLDDSYTKVSPARVERTTLTSLQYRNTFRLALPKGRQYLMQVLDEHELNEWIARINYASAFRTAGLRMRTTGLSGRDGELMGIAATNSHVRETFFWQQQLQSGSSSNVHKWVTRDGSPAPIHIEDDDNDNDYPNLSSSPASGRRPSRLLPISRSTTCLDLEIPGSSLHEEAEQIKAVFEGVKAELAANPPFLPGSSEGRVSRKDASRPYTSPSPEKLAGSEKAPREIELPQERVSSRGNVLQLKVEELEKRISALHQQLESDLRHARNLAILTPFRQTTRTRLYEQVQLLSKRVAQERLELTKLRCHREVLHIDYRTTRAALKTATATQKYRLGDASPQNTKPPRKPVEPTLTQQPRGAQPLRQDSFASTSSSNRDGRTNEPVSSRVSVELTPKRRYNRSLPASELPASPVRQEVPVFSPDEPLSAIEGSFQERRLTEQAEEWNKTRAAKRVSLVTLHPDSLKPLAARGLYDEVLASLREISTIE